MTSQNAKDPFDLVRVKYRQMGGIVRGLEEEWSNFTKRHRRWREDLPNLMPGLEREEQLRDHKRMNHQFVPPMKNFSTWINGRWWTLDATDPGAKKKALDRKREEKRHGQERELYQSLFESKTVEELREEYTKPVYAHVRWLIKEIAQTKKEQYE